MSLSAAGLKAAILAQFGSPATTKEEFAEKMATAIIGYLVANTVVLPTPALNAPGGGGPVTGTGSIS